MANVNTTPPKPPSPDAIPFRPRITDLSFTSSSPLPPNYTRELDPSGRPYYANRTEGTTSWYHPSAVRPSQDPRLPAHIERAVDVRGRSYFINHETKETSWLNPLKIDAVLARGEGRERLRERTEDNLADYWVDYVKGTVTQPLKSLIPWYGEEFELTGRLNEEGITGTGEVKMAEEGTA